MANFLEIPVGIIVRPPSAGLEPGQTDYGDLGYNYSTVEIVIEAIGQGTTMQDLLKHLIDKQTKYNTVKFRDLVDVVLDIISRNLVAKSKATIIHPPIAKVTLEYL